MRSRGCATWRSRRCTSRWRSSSGSERRSPSACSHGGNHVSPMLPPSFASCGGTSRFPHTPSTRSLGRGCPMSAISRREARRGAVFMLFQWDVTGRPLGSLYEGEVDDDARELAEAVSEHAPELDARITAASADWTADRLGAVERNVLRVALEELDEGEVPLEVVLDEAVTLAKRYASEDAARLVNGILGRLVRERERTT